MKQKYSISKTKILNILIACIFLIYFGCYNIKIVAQENKLIFSHITVDEGLSQNTIHDIVKDKFGFMWFGTWEGVCRFDGYKFTVYRAEENKLNALSNNRINYLFKDSNQIIWVVTGDQVICCYNYETDDFTRLSYDKIPTYILNGLSRNNNYSRSHVQNSEFNWYADYNKKELIQISKSSKTQITYSKDPFDARTLSDYNLTNIYLDNTGILWVGTENGGINIADTRAKPFENYSYSPISSNSLSDNVIRAICEDNSGNIWVGTYNNGVTLIHPQKQQFNHYKNNAQTSNSIINNQIRSLYCDRFGCIWIGTKKGLSRYNPKTDHFNQYSVSGKNPIPNNWVFWITEDHLGYLWIGTFNGIAKYDRKNNRFTFYNPEGMLKSKNVRVILEDHNYNFWIATEGGGISLIKRDSSNGIPEKLKPVKHFLYSPNDSNTIINNMVLTMAEDENGMIWIGTNSGLCRLNPRNNSFKRFSVNTGFPDNLIMGIICDYKGFIWISHKKGITRLNTNTFAIRTYTKADGLSGNEFSQNAYYRSKQSGKIFFGGTNGMNAFHPAKIKDNPFYPNIVFTSLAILNQPVQINQKINGRVILEKSLLVTNKITLHYEDKSISIEFAGIHYSNPKGNKYRYILDGFDKDWISTEGTNRTANYSNLQPGTYTLRVKAANSDGIWNPNEKKLQVTVLPPWWRSWWAYILYSLCILSLLYFAFRLVVSRAEMRNQIAMEHLNAKKEQEISQLKMDFFTNISHEFRTPLSLIIDPLEKLKNEKIDATKAKGYYTLMHRNAIRLLRLINQLLDFRKADTGHLKLELSHSDIIEFVKNIVDTFTHQSKQRNILLQFDSFSTNYQTNFDTDKLDKILINLLSNAFKYTNDGGIIKVSVKIESKDYAPTNTKDYIHIRISDTGIGIPKNDIAKIFNLFYQAEGNEPYYGESSGIGLALTKKLVEIHRGEICVESEPGQGSCFTVLLPIILTDVKIQTEPMCNIPLIENSMPKTETYSEDNKLITIENTAIEKENLPVLLLVEDNDDICTYLSGELSELYSILQANNGSDGYNTAIDSIPDLIISDVMMPLMNGFDLCKKLKTDERTSHIPIILLTARQSDKFKIEGFETGADAYLTKPFNTAILKAQVKNLIDSRQKLRELFGKSDLFDLKAMAINLTDETFLNKAVEIIKENVAVLDFDTEILANKLNMSLRQLYRKIKALTDNTVHDFITTIRLNIAAELLLSGNFTISEIAYKVGYSEPANFTRSFTKKFGKNPSAYIQGFKNVQ